MKLVLIPFVRLVLSTGFRAFVKYFGGRKRSNSFLNYKEGLVYRLTWNVQFKILIRWLLTCQREEWLLMEGCLFRRHQMDRKGTIKM